MGRRYCEMGVSCSELRAQLLDLTHCSSTHHHLKHTTRLLSSRLIRLSPSSLPFQRKEVQMPSSHASHSLGRPGRLQIEASHAPKCILVASVIATVSFGAAIQPYVCL